RKAWLADFNQGLLCLSGASRGELGKVLLKDGVDAALDIAKYWQTIFNDRFYIELQRTGRANENEYNEQVIDISVAINIPLVATNDVRFLEASEFEAHEARVCINEGCVLDDPRRERLYSDQQYLRSTEDMLALFSDLPEAIENTVEVAKRCSMFVELGKSYLPNYPIPEGLTLEEFFRKLSLAGLEKRLEKLLAEGVNNKSTRQDYLERLDFELNIINAMGFP